MHHKTTFSYGLLAPSFLVLALAIAMSSCANLETQNDQMIALATTKVAAEENRDAATRFPDKEERDRRIAEMTSEIPPPGLRYEFQSGDTISIQSLRYPELDRTITIDRSGNIVFPFLGETHVAGLSATGLTDRITDAVSSDGAYTDPVVTVTLISSVPQNVYVLGEVKVPGKVQVVETISLLEAIAAAGGQTYDARMSNVLLIRGSTTPPRMVKLDLQNMFKPTSPVPLLTLPLIAGDVVYVPSTVIANVERFTIQLRNIIRPFLEIEQGIILYDAVDKFLWGEGNNNNSNNVIVIDTTLGD